MVIVFQRLFPLSLRYITRSSEKTFHNPQKFGKHYKSVSPRLHLERKNLSGMSLWSHADRKVFAIIQSNRVFIPIHMLNYSKVSKSLNKKQSQRFSEVERVKSNYRYCLHPIWDGCFTMIISVTTVYLTNYKFSYLVMEINQKRAKKFNLRSVKPSVSVQFVMLEPTQNKLKILLSIQMK